MVDIAVHRGPFTVECTAAGDANWHIHLESSVNGVIVAVDTPRTMWGVGFPLGLRPRLIRPRDSSLSRFRGKDRTQQERIEAEIAYIKAAIYRYEGIPMTTEERATKATSSQAIEQVLG